jgi:hypothetical protein
MNARLAPRCVALCALLVASGVEAQALPGLHVSACPGVDEAELGRLLTIELHTMGADASALQELRVTCREGAVHVEARSQAQAPVSAELVLEPGEQGALTRLLALRISELLATLPPAETHAPATPPPPALPLPPPASSTIDGEPPPAANERTARGRVELSFVARHMATPGTWLEGASAGYALPLPAGFALESDLSMTSGRADVQLAEVAVRDLSVGLSLLWYLSTRFVDLGAGPGFRAAWTWLEARDVAVAHQGRCLAAPWAGPFAAGRLRLHGRGPVCATLGLEAGYVVVPVQGLLDGESTLFSIDGPWLAGQLGLAYRW